MYLEKSKRLIIYNEENNIYIYIYIFLFIYIYIARLLRNASSEVVGAGQRVCSTTAQGRPRSV
jgi:hypothetical protein